ncbi:MAG: DUF2029 domain-containing protein [Acidobacteria bacterium]|nr:DUF2029 domain-containing protein [Acidobacteriota bacterium]
MRPIDAGQWAHTILRFSRLAVALLAAAFIALFYYIAIHRFRFPLQLEWIEGAVLDMVRRAANHQPVYAAPGRMYVALIYTPVYIYVSAWLSRLMGVNLITLRVVSILATTGCLIAIFSYVKRITRDNFSALLACGLFAALYAQSGAWYDLGRVDMLYLLFLLLALDASQRGLSIWSAIAFALAFQTKQSAAIIALFVLAHELRRPRKMIAGLGTFALTAGLSSWWFNRESLGWYRYYTVFLPSHHSWMMSKGATYILHDLIAPLGIALLLIMAASIPVLLHRTPDRRQLYFYVFSAAGILISTLSSRLHLGGSTNVDLPLYAGVCVLFGLSISTILAWGSTLQSPASDALQATLMVACGLQMIQLFHAPREFIPTQAQFAYAHEVDQSLHAMRGEIFVFHNVADSGSSGERQLANWMAIWDVLRADRGPAGQGLRAELIDSFKQKEYAGVLSEDVPNELDPWEVDSLKPIADAAAAAYPKQERIVPLNEWTSFYFNQATPSIRPQFLYKPR